MGHRKSLLAAALLAVAVSAPSIAQPEAISDDALEEVSGQGLQVVENHNATFPGAGSQGLGSTNLQNNNVDSVQMNDKALSRKDEEASIGYGAVLANSAVNTTSNFLRVGAENGGGNFSKSFKQTNRAYAKNHTNMANMGASGTLYSVAGNLNKQTQRVNNEIRKGDILEVVEQNNNNNSVQLNDNAQKNAQGILHTNAAASAVNSGENYVAASTLTETTGVQVNHQNASNFENYASAVANESSIALASNTESQGAQFVNNGGEILEHEETKSENVVIYKQNNNNNSVQLNDNAQKGANFMTLKNISTSAANNGINILKADSITASKISQYNTQNAGNHNNYAVSAGDALAFNLNKERQYVDNGRYYDEREIDLTMQRDEKTEIYPDAVIKDQNNNNNSVQLNGDAQRDASALIAENLANSASNTGFNAVYVSGDTTDSGIVQKNTQIARNFNNIAMGNTGGAAGNAEQGATQTVDNFWTTVEKQNNNNNSVQLNNNAQRDMAGVIIENAANSATNVGMNVLSGSDVDSTVAAGAFSTALKQENDQKALNHFNLAKGKGSIAANINKQTQVVKNYATDEPLDLAIVEKQNNNNNSVQLNDDAQRGATSVVLSNTALSALNIGMNVMNAGSFNGEISQVNKQIASNFDNVAEGDVIAIAANAELTGGEFYKTGEPENGQMIENVHAWIPEGEVQNNNNNSVQLNDNAQRAASGMSISNVANSAVNIGFNILSLDSVEEGTVEQKNLQSASNHTNVATAAIAFAGNVNKEKQYIYNCNCLAIEGEQNNNMNSTQLNGNAQMDVNALTLLNASASAANIGINMINATNVSGGTIQQTNNASASNFSNTATGFVGIAGNGDFGVDITFPSF